MLFESASSLSSLAGRILTVLILVQIVKLAIKLPLMYLKRIQRFKLFEQYGIPGPKPRLYDGHLGYIMKNMQQAHIEFRKKYGKIYGYFIGDHPEMIITDLDKLKKIFVDKNDSFKERTYNYVDFPLTESILLAKQEQWLFLRKMMLPQFSSCKVRGSPYTQFIEKTLEKMCFYIDEKVSGAERQGKKSANIDMHDLMKSVALDVISNLAVKIPDVRVREQDDYVKALDSFLIAADTGLSSMALSFPFLRPLFSFILTKFEHGKTTKQINNSLKKMMRESPTVIDKSRSSLIDLLLRLYHEGKISANGVLGNVEAILIAGYDTTSTTLAYTFWALAKHPHIQQRLREDIIAHGIESQYLDQVLNESMRLYPAVVSFISRMSTEKADVDGLIIPKGVKVVYQALLINRDPDIWPEPLKFDPERFKPGIKHHPCAFAPFGLGERECLGFNLARLVLKSVLCDIFIRYRLKLVAPQQLDLVFYSTVLTKPSERIMLEVERV